MTETLTRPARSPESEYGDKKVAGPETPSLDTLDSMLDAQSPKEAPTTGEQMELFEVPTPETPEARPALSPAAELVQRGAARITSFLERRAVNSAHAEALKDYREGITGREDPNATPKERAEHRKLEATGYIDHLDALANYKNEAGQALPGQEFGQKQFNREIRREDRAEKFAKGRDRLRNIGSLALDFSVGVAVMAGEQAKKGAKAVQEKAGERWEEREKARALKDLEKEFAKQAAKTDKETAQRRKDQERLDAQRERNEQKERDRNAKIERAQARKDAALARKRARRQKWSRRKDRVVGAYESTQEFRRKQQQRIGAFAMRARTAGRAARDAWNNPDQYN